MPIQILEGSSRHRWLRIGSWSLLIVVGLLVAFAYAEAGSIDIAGNTYNISMIRVNKAIAFAIAILGMQVATGFTGQLAIGQSFFVGLGAYLAAWLMADYGWPFLAVFVVVVPAGFVIGLIMGLPALRIQGLYLALVTLGFAAVFPAIVQLEALKDFTNGATGKTTAADGRRYKFEAPEWLPLDGIAEALQVLPLIGGSFGDGPISDKSEGRIWAFIIFSAIALACFGAVRSLLNSRQGRAMRAVRDNPTGAAVAGVDLARTKAIAFGIASALGAIGGVIYVAEVGTAAPGDFTQLLAINFIVGMVVGGVGTLSGAVIGALVIVFIPDWAASTQSVGFLPERWLQGPTGLFLLGVLLIVLTFVLPGGIASATTKLRRKLVQVIPAAPELPVDVPIVDDDTDLIASP